MTGHKKLATRHGFTLIELLIALTILSILSLLGYRGVSALLVAEKRLEEDTKRMQMIDRFFSEFEHDIIFAAPRPVRITDTATEPALYGTPIDAQGNYRINLSRFAPAPDMPPQRISYIFSVPTISLVAAASMDFPASADEQPTMLLDGLQSASVRFLDADGRWSATWPPTAIKEAMPTAVELILVLDDLGTVSRLIARP
ncbi:MAG: type II secretion system minor pseudopilin GspJ [Sulfuritalea sp.]|jgi:general secretion pathway protein J|nr:type II secretion system minor pseudopilin GspJ [Sulfuritalea sp.]